LATVHGSNSKSIRNFEVTKSASHVEEQVDRNDNKNKREIQSQDKKGQF
jgi:hypothetical protein